MLALLRRYIFKQKMKEQAMDKTRGYIFIILASIAWSTMGIFGKLAFRYEISPETLIALRLLISFSALFIPVLLFKREFLKILRKDLLYFFILGIFATAFQRVAYFYALDLTTATMAAILFFTYPIFVTIYAALFHNERITRTTIIAIILSFSGVALVVKVYEISSSNVSILGIIFGLLSSMLFVLYFFITKRLRNTYTNWTLILYGDFIGTLTLSFIVVSHFSEIVKYPPQLWLLIVAIACFSSLIGYLLYSYALKYVESSKGSILTVMEPLAIAIMSALILKEKIEFPQIAGIALTLVGIAFLFYKYEE